MPFDAQLLEPVESGFDPNLLEPVEEPNSAEQTKALVADAKRAQLEASRPKHWWEAPLLGATEAAQEPVVSPEAITKGIESVVSRIPVHRLGPIGPATPGSAREGLEQFAGELGAGLTTPTVAGAIALAPLAPEVIGPIFGYQGYKDVPEAIAQAVEGATPAEKVKGAARALLDVAMVGGAAKALRNPRIPNLPLTESELARLPGGPPAEPPEPPLVSPQGYRVKGGGRFESDSPPPPEAINVSTVEVNGKKTYTFRLPPKEVSPTTEGVSEATLNRLEQEAKAPEHPTPPATEAEKAQVAPQAVPIIRSPSGKIYEGTTHFDAFNKALDAGENLQPSPDAIAKHEALGLELPTSNYESGWKVGTEIQLGEGQPRAPEPQVQPAVAEPTLLDKPASWWTAKNLAGLTPAERQRIANSLSVKSTTPATLAKRAQERLAAKQPTKGTTSEKEKGQKEEVLTQPAENRFGANPVWLKELAKPENADIAEIWKRYQDTGDPNAHQILTGGTRGLLLRLSDVREMMREYPSLLKPTAAETPSTPPVPKEVADALGEWRKAEKQFRRALRQEPSEVPDAQQARDEAELNFRMLAEKNKISQEQFDALRKSATETDTQQMPTLGAQPEGPGMTGMGAAVPAEFERGLGTPTSIKNAKVDAERAERGLPPMITDLRRRFGEVWDKAMAEIDRDPGVQDRLIQELSDKPRALTDREDALLLHRRVDLRNEYGKATRDLAQAYDDGRTADVMDIMERVAAWSDKLQELENITKSSGTETARGLSARRMMANEDFTLAKMMLDKRAANGGRQLTPKETVDIQKIHDEYQRKLARLEAHNAELQRRLAEITKGSKRKVPVFDEAGTGMQADLERTKNRWNVDLDKDKMITRSRWQRGLDAFVRWERAFKLSSPVVFGKLTAAALTRAVTTGTEEVLGGAMGKVPGISRVAKQAPREGGLNVKAMAHGLTEGLTKGMKDAAQTFRTGAADLDVAFGGKLMDKDWANFFGQLHGMLKAPVKRAEFTLSLEKRFQHAIRNGIDVTDPMVQQRISAEALNDAYRSIFMQHNFASDMFNNMVSMMESWKKYQPIGEISARTLRFLLPIVRVPTNIVGETLTGVYGVPAASARVMFYAIKGTLDNLPPETADGIMRQFKKGSIGLGLMAIGYLSPQMIGGYDWREKRRAGTVKTGGFQVPALAGKWPVDKDGNIPRWMTHAPWFELMQFGATIRHVQEQHLRGEPKGVGEGLWAAATGLLDETPFLGEMTRMAKVVSGSTQERQYELGELTKSTLVPQAVNWIAQATDPEDKRKARTVWEHIKSAIPGLRETLPPK